MERHQVAQVIQELRFESEEELTPRQAFSKFQDWYREQSGGQTPKLSLDEFKIIDEAVCNQMAKPLQRAALELDKAEADAKQTVVDLIYSQEPEGPEDVRGLLKLSQDIRGKSDIAIRAAITEAVRRFGGEEIKAQVEAVWPGMLEGDE